MKQAPRACDSHCAGFAPVWRAEESDVSLWQYSRPFKAVRPIPEYASRVAALPYDGYEQRRSPRDGKGQSLFVPPCRQGGGRFAVGTELYSEAVYLARRRKISKSSKPTVSAKGQDGLHVHIPSDNGRQKPDGSRRLRVDRRLYEQCHKET